MTLNELRERLDERLILEREEAYDARRGSPNSYGHGYSEGFVDALQTVLNTINDGDDNIL